MNDGNVVIPFVDEDDEEKSLEEIAKEKKARRKLLKEEAAGKRQSIADMEKQIAEMQKKIKQEQRALQKSRNSVRAHWLILTAVDVIAALGFAEKEKSCVTDEDYKSLKSAVIRKVKRENVNDNNGQK